MNTRNIAIDTSSRFTKILLSPEDADMALQVSPLFIAYLQNKIEAYAHSVVSQTLEYHSDPHQQVKAIIEYERLKNFVSAFEELLTEILDAQQGDSSEQL